MRILWLACVVAAMLAVKSAAQDITATPVEWLSPIDPPDELPVLGSIRPGRPTDPLRDYPGIAYSEVKATVAPDGNVVTWAFGSTSPFLRPHDHYTGGRKSSNQAARRDGQSVASEIRFFLIYNPPSAHPRTATSTPRLVQIVAPTHPAPEDDTLPPNIVIEVDAKIDPAGAVEQVDLVRETPEAFASAAVQAVRRWQFTPAREQGQAVAATVRLPVLFQTAVPPKGAKQQPPRVRKQPGPIYPRSMHLAGIEGEVLVSFVVTVEGRVRQAYAIRSTTPAFDEAAVDAVERWVFEPGTVDGRVVNTRMQVPVIFSIHGQRAEAFVLRRPRKFPDKLPESFHWDHAPKLIGFAPPVYPPAALEEKRQGEVTVTFFVGPQGRVIRAEATGAPDPDLRAAAIAAVETFTFNPAARQGQPCYAAANMKFDFRASGLGDAPVPREVDRLLSLLRRRPEQLASLAELDAEPRPLGRRPPVFPIAREIANQRGEALIEFIIDRKGFARLPRVLEATDPAFGYAAAQAISNWRYETPLKDGKPIDAVVRIPVRFSAGN